MRPLLLLLLLQMLLAPLTQATGPAAPCTHHTLANGVVSAVISAAGRLVAVSDNKTSVTVAGDDFQIELDGAPTTASTIVLSSATFSGQPTVQPGANATSVAVRWEFKELAVEVRYSLVSATARFVEKQLRLLRPSASSSSVKSARNITKITVFDRIALSSAGAPPTSSITASSKYGTYGLGDYAVFHRFGAKQGAFLTAQNPYLATATAAGVTTLSYGPMMVVEIATPETFAIDAGLVGLPTAFTGETLPPPALPLDAAEHQAMVACLREYLVVPQSANSTVKINIGWTENDFQLDIANESNRTIYKRIIDRAAAFGITHLLFAPQNSDVSCAQNNTDAWQWEQVLWFGMGQRLRLGLWKPGDALPISLTEMLGYMKNKGVKPVACE